jgi:hypothetical protein
MILGEVQFVILTIVSSATAVQMKMILKVAIGVVRKVGRISDFVKA